MRDNVFANDAVDACHQLAGRKSFAVASDLSAACRFDINKRGRHSLAGNVGDANSSLVIVKLDYVEVVAANGAGRFPRDRELETLKLQATVAGVSAR